MYLFQIPDSSKQCFLSTAQEFKGLESRDVDLYPSMDNFHAVCNHALLWEGENGHLNIPGLIQLQHVLCRLR